jgi:hypothetical protein
MHMDPTAKSRAPGTLVEISVPASGNFIELLRGTAGRVARIAGMTYNGIEDFSLAVDEAAVLLLESQPTAMTMSISLGQGTGLVVRLATISPRREWPPDDLESDTRWRIIGAMCEEMWLLDGDNTGIGLAQSVR